MNLKKNILIVDDEEGIHYVFDRYLGNKFSLFHAATVDEAVKKCIKEQQIDLIITDIFLEKDTGFEFVHKVREMNKKVPIIIMSAYGDQFTTDLIDNIKATFDCHFINKPFDNDEMESLIEELLKKS